MNEEALRQIVLSTPNDTELGKKIREYFQLFDNTKKENYTNYQTGNKQILFG